MIGLGFVNLGGSAFDYPFQNSFSAQIVFIAADTFCDIISLQVKTFGHLARHKIRSRAWRSTISHHPVDMRGRAPAITVYDKLRKQL